MNLWLFIITFSLFCINFCLSFLMYENWKHLWMHQFTFSCQRFWIEVHTYDWEVYKIIFMLGNEVNTMALLNWRNWMTRLENSWIVDTSNFLVKVLLLHDRLDLTNIWYIYLKHLISWISYLKLICFSI